MLTPATSLQPSLRIAWEPDAHGDHVALRLEGRLGVGSMHRVDEALAGAVLGGHREVTVDASAVDGLDAAGWRRLRRVVARWREPGLRLSLRETGG